MIALFYGLVAKQWLQQEAIVQLIMYAEDTFFHLTPAARVGLVILSAALSAVSLLIHWRFCRYFKSRLLRIFLALVGFVLFVWLSPQVYYAYFRAVLDGLPPQIVVSSTPNMRLAIEHLTFRSEATISHHGQASLGWTLICVSLLSPTSRKTAA